MKITYRFIFLVLVIPVLSRSQILQVGHTAPDFSLPRYGGGTLTNTEFSGKIIFYNFFGSG
jgi:hypothetical protein